eukprot:gene65755-89973_t
MDGVAATRAIRALPGAVSRTPIIALTANADPDDVRGYLEAGMNDVVEKPIKAEQMLDRQQLAAIERRQEADAGIDSLVAQPPAIEPADDDGTGAAIALGAALLAAGQA